MPDGKEPPISIKGMDKYEWLPGRKFLLHHVDVWMGDEKVNAVEVIGPCGDDLTAIPMHSFDNSGNHGLMHARQESSNVWSFSNQELRTRLTVLDGGASMTARWERKVLGGDWRPWLKMQFVKTT